MKNSLPVLLLLGCAACVLAGIVELFQLRFESGDVYPMYSSYRADPLGTMAFYESLNSLPGITAVRDIMPGNQLPTCNGVTYLHLAAPLDAWKTIPEDLFGELETFLNHGGRFVITLFPEPAGGRRRGHKADPAKSHPHKEENNGDQEDDPGDPVKPGPPDPRPRKGVAAGKINLYSVKDRWGLDFSMLDLSAGKDDAYEPVQVHNKLGGSLPETILWHSGIVCAGLSPAWKPIYERGTNPVVIERRFGRGSVVVATDSFFLSNEAIMKSRQSGFLAWLVGGGGEIYFDEAHLGVVSSPGVAALIGRYRLHGLMAGLALLAGLFIWKNSTSLAPARASGGEDGHIAGKEASGGLINLLRRNVSADQLEEVCFEEWKKSADRGGGIPVARREAAERAFQQARSRSDPVKTYQSICAALGANKQRQNPFSKSDHES